MSYKSHSWQNHSVDLHVLVQDALADAWRATASTAMEEGREDHNRGARGLLVGFSIPQLTVRSRNHKLLSLWNQGCHFGENLKKLGIKSLSPWLRFCERLAMDGIWALSFGRALVVSRTAQRDSFFSVSANSIVSGACPPYPMQLFLSIFFAFFYLGKS